MTNRARSRRRHRGASLIELLVVLAIIAILTALLLVAVQYSREAARRTVCQNNLRQLSMAMRMYVEARKRYPDLATSGQASGWVVELLPFLEEQALQDELKARPALTGENVSPLVRKRPPLFTCPNGFDGDSAIAGTPAAHYLLEELTLKEAMNRKRRRSWYFFEAPLETRTAWAAGPEAPNYFSVDPRFPPKTGPHSGGFYGISSSDESCSFWVPRETQQPAKK